MDTDTRKAREDARRALLSKIEHERRLLAEYPTPDQTRGSQTATSYPGVAASPAGEPREEKL